MNAYQRKRLLKLADFLTTMPKAKFAFDIIFMQGSKAPLDALAAGEHQCGTVGCAIGWMPAALPRVAKWSMTTNSLGKTVVDDVVLRSDEDVSNYEAAVHAFGITYNEAVWLFSPLGGGGMFGNRYSHQVHGNAKSTKVANHIRRFVDDYPKHGALVTAAQRAAR